MFHHTHVSPFLLVISDLYFKRLISEVFVQIQLVVRPPALACHVECIAGVDANVLIPRGVINHVLARKFDLAVIVSAIEADPPLGSGMPRWLVSELANSRITQILGLDSVP